MESNASSSRTERKFIERNRRNQMKLLYSKLNSLVPHLSSREAASLPDQLEEATNYIKKLQMKVERMKDKKSSLMGIDQKPSMGIKSPQIEIHQMGLALEIVVITALDCQSMFNELIRIVHEEGADVVHASYTAAEDAIFHIIHCQVGESADGAARLSERLNKFVYDSSAFSDE